jgi:phage tail-like protein
MKQNEIAYLLPGIFQRTLRPGSPLAAILAVMEGLSAVPEETLAHVESFFNPYRTPDRFVPFLADWVDLEWLLIQNPEERAQTGTAPLESGLGRLRELIAASAYLSQMRGTARGLILFLETATGIPGFSIVENRAADGKTRQFHMCIHAPAPSAVYRGMIERIVEFEKPAFLTYELVFNK